MAMVVNYFKLGEKYQKIHALFHKILSMTSSTSATTLLINFTSKVINNCPKCLAIVTIHVFVIL